jgi:hypothetical protein
MSLSFTLGILVFLALIWILFGGIVAAGIHPALPSQPVGRAVLEAGSFTAAMLLLLLWVFLKRRSRLAYFLGLALMAAMSLSVFLDEVGWVDLTFLGFCLGILMLLIKDRNWFLQKSE